MVSIKYNSSFKIQQLQNHVVIIFVIVNSNSTSHSEIKRLEKKLGRDRRKIPPSILLQLLLFPSYTPLSPSTSSYTSSTSSYTSLSPPASVLYSFISSFLRLIILNLLLPPSYNPLSTHTFVLYSFISSYLRPILLYLLLPSSYNPLSPPTSVLYSFISSYLLLCSFISSYLRPKLLYLPYLRPMLLYLLLPPFYAPLSPPTSVHPGV